MSVNQHKLANQQLAVAPVLFLHNEMTTHHFVNY